jgi:hypothetical protein
MRPSLIMRASVLAVLLGGLVTGCGGPPMSLPATTPSVASEPSPPPNSPIVPPDDLLVDATPAEALAASQQTCDLFRQMIEGVNTLSTGELQDLVVRMVDAVEWSQDPDLMIAVVDFGEGYLLSDPTRFAQGMRSLSAICEVPYE